MNVKLIYNGETSQELERMTKFIQEVLDDPEFQVICSPELTKSLSYETGRN